MGARKAHIFRNYLIGTTYSAVAQGQWVGADKWGKSSATTADIQGNENHGFYTQW